MKSTGPNVLLSPLLALSERLESGFNIKTFPEDAFQALDELNFDVGFEDFEKAVALWLLELRKLPKQVNLYNVFGEPSISLFHNDKFSVDVYFWRKNDTLIHSHGFRGAFKVLYGKSLHEEFEVQTFDDLELQSLTSAKSDHISNMSDVIRSKVTLSKSEILNSGDTRIILPGMDLVHRVLHLDNPTVTLCLRTVNDKDLSQWHHLSSGISYRQRNIDELTIKRVLYFQFLLESNPVVGKEYLDNVLAETSVAAQLALYESFYKDEFGLSHETTYFMIQYMRTRFENLEWFAQYERHYQKMSESLFEAQASEGYLKLLAHGINSNYSAQDIRTLLKGLTHKDVVTLCQNLLDEDSIFNDDYFEAQQDLIMNFAKGIV